MRGRVVLVVLSVTMVLLGLISFWYGQSGFSATSAPQPSIAPPVPDEAYEEIAPEPAEPAAASKPAFSPPARGNGRFTVAGGSGRRIGHAGRLVRYQTMVEDGAGVTADAFAAAVEATLADPRSWTAAGRWSFERVPGGPTDLFIHLATAGTTNVECARRGVQTRGEVSCRGGNDVFINLKRWLLAVPWYADAREDYRRMVVNHEVGHFLGHGHVLCPQRGSLAPVMQRQTLDLAGCRRNPWPYPDGHGYVTGPSAPR
jgi:hypothetical protein